MIASSYAVVAIFAMAAVTIALRALPFFGASLLKHHPVVERLGRFLPSAIITLLLVHTLYDSAATDPQRSWQVVVAIMATIVTQLLWRQALASILIGTVLYVAFRNLVIFV